MDVVAFDLTSLCRQNGGGGFTTRFQRQRGLQLIARQLRHMGYGLGGARSIKPKHVTALVERWKSEGLSPGTIRNRLSWLRWWTGQVRKVTVIPAANRELGIEPRRPPTRFRAHTTTADAMSGLSARMQLALRLQMAFGLRLEESLKFRVRSADQGDHIALHSSWCKGGRARVIPLTHDRQRALLDEIRRLCGDGSLVPDGQSYIGYRQHLESAVWGAGIRNMHGHRHWYAQWRYRTLTGAPCPAAGGKTVDRMSRTERGADLRARLAISRELGHERLSTTDTYLGSRFAPRRR